MNTNTEAQISSEHKQIETELRNLKEFVGGEPPRKAHRLEVVQEEPSAGQECPEAEAPFQGQGAAGRAAPARTKARSRWRSLVPTCPEMFHQASDFEGGARIDQVRSAEDPHPLVLLVEGPLGGNGAQVEGGPSGRSFSGAARRVARFGPH